MQVVSIKDNGVNRMAFWWIFSLLPFYHQYCDAQQVFSASEGTKCGIVKHGRKSWRLSEFEGLSSGQNRSFVMETPKMNIYRTKQYLLLSCILFGISACSSPQSGSEEYWFNKMQMEQRAQCSQLPEPLASNCLRDNAAKSYQDFVRERAERNTAQQH